MAWLVGREAETGTFEKRVVLGRTSLGGHVPEAEHLLSLHPVLVPRASVGSLMLGLGLKTRLCQQRDPHSHVLAALQQDTITGIGLGWGGAQPSSTPLGLAGGSLASQGGIWDMTIALKPDRPVWHSHALAWPATCQDSHFWSRRKGRLHIF